MNVNGFRRVIRHIEPGTTVFIDAINLTPRCIDQLRECIKDGTLIPDISEVEKMIVPDSVDKVMSGEIICPQMDYIKNYKSL